VLTLRACCEPVIATVVQDKANGVLGHVQGLGLGVPSVTISGSAGTSTVNPPSGCGSSTTVNSSVSGVTVSSHLE